MAYERQNFKNGQLLTAECLNRIEEGICGLHYTDLGTLNEDFEAFLSEMAEPGRYTFRDAADDIPYQYFLDVVNGEDDDPRSYQTLWSTQYGLSRIYHRNGYGGGADWVWDNWTCLNDGFTDLGTMDGYEPDGIMEKSQFRNEGKYKFVTLNGEMVTAIVEIAGNHIWQTYWTDWGEAEDIYRRSGEYSTSGRKWVFTKWKRYATQDEVKALDERVEALEENGGGSGANVMIVNMTWNAEYECMLCDKTTDEMLEATNNGIIVIGLMKEQTHGTAIASHEYAACFLFYANVAMVQYWLGEYICEKEMDTIDGEEREVWYYSPQPLGDTVVRLYDGVPQMDVYRISEITRSGRSVVLEAKGDVYTYVGGGYPYHFVRYDPEEGILYGCNVYDDHVEYFDRSIPSGSGGANVLTVTLNEDGVPNVTMAEVYNHCQNGGQVVLEDRNGIHHCNAYGEEYVRFSWVDAEECRILTCHVTDDGSEQFDTGYNGYGDDAMYIRVDRSACTASAGSGQIHIYATSGANVFIKETDGSLYKPISIKPNCVTYFDPNGADGIVTMVNIYSNGTTEDNSWEMV